MKILMAFLLLALGCAYTPALSSQGAADCSGPEYHALDFWLGSWEVASDDSFDGDDVVTAVLGGCALREQWTDASGWQGESLFYYDRAGKGWKQVWITARGDWREKRQVASPEGAVRIAGEHGSTTLRKLPGGKVSQVIQVGGGKAWEGIYSPKASSCATPRHRELDFWLGDWDAVIRSRVSPQSEEWKESRGSNHVSSADNGCTVVEDFHAGGLGSSWTGRSVSQLQQGKWRQTWVDESNSFLAFTGGKEGADFTLYGEAAALPGGGTRQMRMVFSEIKPASFKWRWEGSTDGKTWRPQLLIDYTRRGL